MNSQMGSGMSTIKKKQCKDYFVLNADTFIIDHTSSWKKVWDISMLIVVFYSCFSTLLIVSFGPELSREVKIMNDITTWYFVLDICFSKL